MKSLLNLIVLCGLLVSLGGVGLADEGDTPELESTSTPSGMPGRPFPERPIPHHEPGHLSKAGDYRTAVTRWEANNVRETVELTGLEAMLADGTMSDPFQGNYTFVAADQIMVANSVVTGKPGFPPIVTYTVHTRGWDAFEAPDTLVKPDFISGSRIQPGGSGDLYPNTIPSIAAGDLNGDGQDEQIVAWLDSGGTLSLSTGELPGSEGIVKSDPVAVAHDDGQMDLLVRGYDEALWHRHYDGTAWGDWNNEAGGYLLSGPALASRGDGTFDVFAAGVYTDAPTAIYQHHWDGSDWAADWDLVDVHLSDGAELVGNPAATTRGTDQIDLFSRASDNTLRWLHYDGTAWGTWQNLGGIVTSAPTAISRGPNHIQVFARGVDHMLWHVAYNGSAWGAWQRVDGLELTSKPTAVYSATSEIHVYARGTDDSLWQNRFSISGSTWSGWQRLETLAMGSGVGALVYDGQIDLFAQTPWALLRQKHYDGSSWGSWQYIGGLEPCCTEYRYGSRDNTEIAVETGHFTGDGREQIVAVTGDGDSFSVLLFDIRDGFKPRYLDSESVNIGVPTTRLYMVTGDLDNEPDRDEIAVVAVRDYGSGQLVSSLYVFNVYPNSPDDWEIEQKDVENFGTVYEHDLMYAAVTSGDLDGNGHDELAYGWVACKDASAAENADCVFDLTVGKVTVSGGNWTIEETDSWDEWDTWPAESGGYNRYPQIDLAAADLNADAKDEIVYIGPAPGTEWYGRLQCYTLNESDEITAKWDGYDIHTETRLRLAAGDFDRDARAEVAAVYQEQLHIYGYDGSFHTLVDSISPDFADNRNFSIATGALTGESLRVGPPSYRRHNDVESIVAIINVPPYHIDTLDGVTTTIAEDAFSAYQMVSGQTDNVSTQYRHNFGLDTSFGAGVGDPRGTHTSVGLDLTFGGSFEKAFTAFESQTFQNDASTVTDDLLVFSDASFDIWEYPVYDDNGQVPIGHISVMLPVREDIASTLRTTPGNLCSGWYKPTHQVGNVWSYPAVGGEDQLNGWNGNDPNDLVYEQEFTTGGIDQGWAIQTFAETSKRESGEFAVGVRSHAELQIGGDEVEMEGGVLFANFKTKSRTPYVSASLDAYYDFSVLSTHEASISRETNVESRYGNVPNDYSFTVKSSLFWAKDGYLKLDYTATPEDHEFWNQYNKPDPAFIRPWTDGHCNSPEEDKTDFSHDIDVSPYYANPGETVTISATVRNFSNEPASDVTVRFYLGDPDDGGQQIGADQVIPTLSRNTTGPQTVSTEWVAEGRGKLRIYAVIDPDNDLPEMHDEVSNVNNNKGYNYIGIGATEYVDPSEAGDRVYYSLTYSQENASANQLRAAGQTQSLAFDAHIPLANLEEVVLFEFVSPESVPSPPAGMAVIGTPVALVAYDGNVAQESFDLKPAPGTPPGVITVQYSDADLHGTLKSEEDLRFYTWTGSEWVEPSCAGHAPQHLVEDNMFIVPICETGTFALFGDAYDIYLPLVIKY